MASGPQRGTGLAKALPWVTLTCLIPPNSFALARSVERFKIPRDVLGVCIGESSYARCGIML